MSVFRSLTVLAFVVAAPAYAQDRMARVDSIFSSISATTPGCAAGVSQNGKVIVEKSYGLADVERARPLDRNSLFDIGSTQKQFTAASMLLLVADKRIALTDDIRKYLPELPDYGRTITVNHLLTHTSGVRDWTGLLPFAPEGTEVMALILRQRGLNFAPGDEWSYSSSGYELAKTLVAKVSGMSFADFTRKRIFEPLGMKSSAYVPDIMQAGANAAMGYQKDGTAWKPYMRLGTNRGGGAIVSTIGDILIWNDALSSGKLGKFVTEKIQEPAKLNNGRALKYARGLMVDSTPGGLVISHSGGAAGFSTWMGRVPEHGLSVTVACNFDPVSATALAGKVADVFLPPLDPNAKRPGPVAAAGVDVSSRAGLYFDERTGDPIRLGGNGARLQFANGPTVVPVSATTFRLARPDLFFRSQDDVEITFTDADHIAMKSMEGQVTRYRRAIPWTPTAAELTGIDGRYESRELGIVFEIIPGANALTLRFENAPEKTSELAAVDRDTYMLRMVIVRFKRDAGGKVTGFEFGNPLVKGIGFTRVGDRKTAAASAPAPVASAAPKLEGLVGEYEMAPGRALAITLENGQLHGQPPNSTKRALVHSAGTTFGVEGAAAMTLTFVVGADGRATSITMKQNGQERVLTRIK